MELQFSCKTSSKEIKSGAYKIPLDLLPEKDRLSGVKNGLFIYKKRSFLLPRSRENYFCFRVFVFHCFFREEITAHTAFFA